ncbi:hypothetical protein VZT92_004036 [Zoarces viviparus]|uniref:Uncharacterized protein n=1 Tax=Zoarces viviparus TaxID=48416 RepID=A0AAW1FVQ8_ZOAVI
MNTCYPQNVDKRLVEDHTTAISPTSIEYRHVCSSHGSRVKLDRYPRVCGSEVLCLLSRCCWARFLRPVGTDHREQHTDDPLSTSSRTAQPLSPEADPAVQDETQRSVDKVAGMLWNGDPENWPGREVDF